MSKSWPDLAFGIVWAATLISLFQLFYELSSAGLVSHPIWSEVFGFPWFHHAYYFHILSLIIWIFMRKKILLQTFKRLLL